MKDDRLRVSVDDPYVHAIGLAMFCFAGLEWDAVWCCEKIQPGYIRTIEEQRKTAGRIASDLVGLAASHPDPVIVQSLGTAAVEFKRLVIERNALMHAKPGTAPNGDQRLFREGESDEWTIERVNDLADEFVAASSPLNHHIHYALPCAVADHT